MINLEVKLADPSWSAGAATLKNQLSQLSAQSFTALLSEAFSETLAKFGIDPSTVRLSVQDQPSQSYATRQTFAASRETPVVAGPVAASPFAANPVASPVAASAVGSPVAASPSPAAAPAASTITMPSQHWYASTPADDAYWATQPAAVQQLREIDDLDQRKAIGAQLASEGYAIDVPIMVWGWDAGKVTAARQSYGYTWVPSAMQQQVSAAPGITGPGITAYDPNNPPKGSIQV